MAASVLGVYPATDFWAPYLLIFYFICLDSWPKFGKSVGRHVRWQVSHPQNLYEWLSNLTLVTVQLGYLQKEFLYFFSHALSNAFYKGGVWFCVRDLVAWHFNMHGSFIIHKYKMAASFIFCILLSFCCLGSVLSAKVAGFSSMAAGSHYFIIRKTMEELSSRGHEVNFHVKYRELPLEPLWLACEMRLLFAGYIVTWSHFYDHLQKSRGLFFVSKIFLSLFHADVSLHLHAFVHLLFVICYYYLSKSTVL